MMHLEYIAIRAARLSTILREEMSLSAGLVNRLKWHEKILVNGKPEHTDFPVQPGDTITVLLDTPEIQYPAEQGELTILYEDDYILAVDKPAGMLIHPSRSKNSGTLANFVLGYYEKTNQACAFHPLTRLDRDTFGVVLLAKNGHVSARLQAGDLQKTYHAVTYGGPEEDAGIIDAPIARKPLPSLLREIREDGKPSVTEYAVLERNRKLCKLKLRPITGRKGGFIAVRFYIAAYGTIGGVRTNKLGEVLDANLEPIPGLYSAGSDCNTIYGDSYNFTLPGNTMGFALNSGRMAGEAIADYING